MPSRREQVRMSDAEALEYLRQQRRVILVTIGAGGMPHAVPMNYGVSDSGIIVMTAFARSQKVRNLERDPRATLLADSGDSYGELAGVMAQCDVRIERDADAVLSGMQQIRIAEGRGEALSESQREQVRASLAKRVLLCCTPRRFISWDHRRLGGYY